MRNVERSWHYSISALSDYKILAISLHNLSMFETKMAPAEAGIWKSLRQWWRRERESRSAARSAQHLCAIFWEFLRESMPERRRRRYGDAEYDWERRVNTTSGGVGARSRFLGLLHSEYQPIEPEIFRELMARMEIEFERFTFVDVGSGKGRALLLAGEYPFRRIVGIELLPELHDIAANNAVHDSRIELRCGDAARFTFPLEPLVVYLFNPLPESGFRKVIGNLVASWRESLRPIYVIYVNPEHEEIVSSCSQLRKIGGTHQYSLFRSVPVTGQDGVALTSLAR